MIKISATLYKINYNKLKEVLTYFFGFYKLQNKTRVLGEEFKYTDSKVEFFCYSSLDKKWQGDEENFIVDAYLKMDREETEGFIDSLSEVFEKNDVIYDIEFTEQDEKGRYNGKEISKRHPKYMDFIKSNYEV